MSGTDLTIYSPINSKCMKPQFAPRQGAFLRARARLLLACFLLLGISAVVRCQSTGVGDSSALEAVVVDSTVNGTCIKGHGCQPTDTLDQRRHLTIVNSDSIAASFANLHPQGLKGLVILLDAGHGGSQDGALYDSVAEKNVNLAVTFKLKARLELMGAIVHMTRISDSTLSLQARVDRSLKLRPDIFVSVHANANRHTSIDGIETYYYDRRSSKLAVTLLKSIAHGLNEHANWVKQEGLFVLHHNNVPSTLVEIGYLSNTRTNLLLSNWSYQERVAESIATGIFNYFQTKNAARGPLIVQKAKSKSRAKTIPHARQPQKHAK